MAQQGSQRILLLGSSGYLGRTLVQRLQQSGLFVVSTCRTRAGAPGSLHYDFWTDDVSPMIDQAGINTVVVAANMAYQITDALLFQQRVTLFVRSCRQCRVIYISSDGIFDGRQGNYSESDIPAPITPYGRNLHSFEHAVQSLCVDYCIIRPSYLYGYSLSQLDTRLAQARTRLLAGEQLSYFTDMWKSPMDVNQVAAAIVQLTCSSYTGIVHVAGPAMNIYDFYRQAMHSLKVPVQNLLPTTMPADFPHPRDTSLDTRLMTQLTGIQPFPIHRALLERSGRGHDE